MGWITFSELLDNLSCKNTLMVNSCISSSTVYFTEIHNQFFNLFRVIPIPVQLNRKTVLKYFATFKFILQFEAVLDVN